MIEYTQAERRQAVAIGLNAEAWRRALGVSNMALAREIGAHPQACRNAEFGNYSFRTTEPVLRRMAAALGVPWLVFIERDPSNPEVAEILTAAAVHVALWRMKSAASTSNKEVA